MRLADFIPAEEDVKAWRTKLSIEAHQGLDDIDPISALFGEIQNASDVCTNFSQSNLFSGIENGYPTSVRLMECGENAHSSKGKISLSRPYKATRISTSFVSYAEQNLLLTALRRYRNLKLPPGQLI